MADLYRRNHNREERTCKFCGATGLKWGEISPNHFRLHDPDGGVHDCRQFHENKRNASPTDPDHNRGSLLRRLNVWAQRWARVLPADAVEELDEIIDEAARR